MGKRKIIDYNIVDGFRGYDVSVAVQNAIKHGWEPKGELIAMQNSSKYAKESIRYSQVIVKYADEIENGS